MATTISTNNVTTIPLTSSSTSTSSTDATTASLQTSSSQFLQMLVTQMQNQDPLNPMDNSQMTSQIAQLNTVQGINDLNTTVGSLQTGMGQMQGLQAANFVGATVLVPGSSIALANGTASMGVDLPSVSDSTSVNIMDASGNVVRTMNLGSTPAGTNQLTWDGKDSTGNTLPDGKYSFSVAANKGTTALKATPLAYSQVTSVSLNGSTVKLNTANLGSASISDVHQIK